MLISSVLIIFDKASDNFNDHLEIVAYNYYDARERQQCYVELNNILIDGYVLQYKEMILI